MVSILVDCYPQDNVWNVAAGGRITSAEIMCNINNMKISNNPQSYSYLSSGKILGWSISVIEFCVDQL